MEAQNFFIKLFSGSCEFTPFHLNPMTLSRKYWYHCVTTALKIKIINLSDFTDLIVLNIQKVKQIHLSDFTNLIVPNIQN